MERPSWLIPEGSDRERTLDMERRLAPRRAGVLALLMIGVLAAGPEKYWWCVPAVLIVGAVFKVAGRRLERAERPEYLIFAAWTGGELVIAACVAVAGGSGTPAMSWLAIPVSVLSARFSTRGVVAGVAVALALMVAVAFGADAQAVMADPVVLIAPFMTVVCIALLSTALMESDREHRTRAVIDPLTGMLNRTALATRAEELRQQSRVTGHPVSVVVCDVDHFKDINDSHGHATGDAVLREVAYVMRKNLRAFDLAYRLGGEEFCVLLPGAGADEAAIIAEQLRSAVAESPVAGGLAVTISLGVGGSPKGGEFDWGAAFAQADAALYEAKWSGRNRVCTPSRGAPAVA